MKVLSQVCLYASLLSIPLAMGFWFVGPNISGGPWEGIGDPALQAAMSAANKERWGMFIGLWPDTLLIFSTILDRLDVSKQTLNPGEGIKEYGVVH